MQTPDYLKQTKKTSDMNTGLKVGFFSKKK